MQYSYSLDDELVDAAFVSDVDAVRLLLARGASPDARDDERRTALMTAVSEQNRELVRVLLEAGADPNLRDEDGWTALDLAVARRTHEIIALLASFGADVHVTRRRPVLTRVVLHHVAASWTVPLAN